MDGHYLSLWIAGGVALAGTVWICIRDAAPAFKVAETIFLLSLPVFWMGTVLGLFGPIRFPVGLWEPPREKIVLPELPPLGPTERYGRSTAVYDIAAHTVYLPSGRRLEAHSGLGNMRDNPRFVSQRNHGATPPNVYELSQLGQLFYGVRALRLTPIGDSPEFGRDGFLAHTYMLGSGSDSHGCIVFRDYHSFLQAYLKGEIERVVVVAHLD
jgi:hypothetical protein